MRWVDMKDSLKNFWNDFRREKSGMVGLFLLVLLIFTAVAAPLITSPDIPQRWKHYWLENPQNAPPTWSNYLSSVRKAPNVVYTYKDLHIKESKDASGNTVYSFEIPYKYDYQVPVKDIVIFNLASNASSPNDAPYISIVLKRPVQDGYSSVVPLMNETVSSNATIQLSTNPQVRMNVLRWLKQNNVHVDPVLEFQLRATMDTMTILFSQIQPDIQDMITNPKPLHGTYTLLVNVTAKPGISVDFSNIKVVFMGRTCGLMGTDDRGRDIWAGLVWGSRVSLTIGLAVAVLSVLIGILYGVTSAYLGGWKDEFMQRFNEFMASIPTLPILILLGVYFGGHIMLWQLVLLLVAFGWVGIAKVARSMALQIKEQTYIEAAKALGAGTGRIVFKHIVPQLLPYAFAQIALGVPGAILSEASLSFLGLGDPSKVTWGQMLNEAQRAGAAVNGYWWEVIPPGLAITLVGLTFVLLGVALDKVLNPRLRRI